MHIWAFLHVSTVSQHTFFLCNYSAITLLKIKKSNVWLKNVRIMYNLLLSAGTLLEKKMLNAK